MRANKKCVICGDEYKYCNSCPQGKNEPSWRNSFCSENCKKIYEACSRYNAGEIDAEEAYLILDDCDLTKMDHFTILTQATIHKLFNEATKVAEKNEKPKKKIEKKEA